MELHTIETRGLCVCGSRAILAHDPGDLVSFQSTRSRVRHFRSIGQSRHASVRDRARGNGLRPAGLEHVVRHPTDMPELTDNLSARLVNGIGHQLPSGDLLGRVNARSIGIPLSLLADLGRLRNDEPRSRSLRVILRVQLVRHAPRAGTAACERRHEDAILEFERTDIDRRKKIRHFPVLEGARNANLTDRTVGCCEPVWDSPATST